MENHHLSAHAGRELEKMHRFQSCHFVGRIDLSDPSAPVFYYAGSYLVACFQGASLRAVFSDEGAWNEYGNQVGFVIDDGELVIRQLVKGAACQVVEVAGGLPDGEHDLVLTKLQGPGNGRGSLTLHGLILDPGQSLLPPPALPRLKIEVYGDSVTEGEGAACPEGVNDCGNLAGNSGWLSYTNTLARHLGCQVHNLGIGGLAVRDETGWYEDGHTGLETTYDRLNPWGECKTPWDFSRYRPDLVIMAMGVNDQSKPGFTDLALWQETYKRIVRDIHARHEGGNLPFLFAVPPINVHEAYQNVAQLVEELKAEGMNALYYRYGFEVNGHPNQPQSARMARELYDFIAL
jgi:lysophospholipase L1-like esterase